MPECRQSISASWPRACHITLFYRSSRGRHESRELLYSAWDASTKHIGMSISRTSKLYLTQRPRCIPLRCKMFVGLVLLRSDYGQSEPCCEDTFSNQRKSGAIRLHVWRISDL